MQHHRNRSVQRHEVQDPRDRTWNLSTKHWAAGYLLDCGIPERLLLHRGTQNVDLVQASDKVFETLLGSMSQRYSGMSYDAMRAQLERAQRVLGSMECISSRIISSIRATYTAQAHNQQQSQHNLNVFKEVTQMLLHMRVPGHSVVPLMSSQPFASTVKSVAA